MIAYIDSSVILRLEGLFFATHDLALSAGERVRSHRDEAVVPRPSTYVPTGGAFLHPPGYLRPKCPFRLI